MSRRKATRCSKCGRPFRAGGAAMIEIWGTIEKVNSEGKRPMSPWTTYQTHSRCLPEWMREHKARALAALEGKP